MDIASSSADIGEFLKIQANYKKGDDGKITLFFNYENYLNSPFVKIKNGRVYTDVVDGTYLKLENGETGVLDIVIQVRYYNGGKLYGYRNVKVLSYEITDLSDDKPKFMIRRIYTAEKDSFFSSVENLDGILRVDNVVAKMTAEDFIKRKEISVGITLWADKMSRKGSSFTVRYPYDVIRFARRSGFGYQVKETKGGVLEVSVVNPEVSRFDLVFETSELAQNMMMYSNFRYGIWLGDVNISAQGGVPLDIKAESGSLTIENDFQSLLTFESGQLAQDENNERFILAHS